MALALVLRLGAAAAAAGLLVAFLVPGVLRPERPGRGLGAKPAASAVARTLGGLATRPPARVATRPLDGAARLPRAAAGSHDRSPILRTTGTSAVALTFDDGPDPNWTPAILDLLRQHRVSATFCVVGANALAFPGLVRRIAGEGHTLCNHSWRHQIGLGTWPADAIRADLIRTNEAIRRALPGAAVPYFRHPGGAWTARAVRVAAGLGMTSIHWDIDPQDWRRPGGAAIARVVTGQTRPGSIILLHDGGGDRSGTVAGCSSLLPDLLNRFRLVALPAPANEIVVRPPSAI